MQCQEQKRIKVIILWGRGKIVSQNYNFRINGEDEDQNMLGVMPSGEKPRTQERERLTWRTSAPVAEILLQASLMVQTTRWLIDSRFILLSGICGRERRSRNSSISRVRANIYSKGDCSAKAMGTGFISVGLDRDIKRRARGWLICIEGFQAFLAGWRVTSGASEDEALERAVSTDTQVTLTKVVRNKTYISKFIEVGRMG